MINGAGAFGSTPLGSHPDELISTLDPLASKLVRGEDRDTILFVQIFNRPVSAAGNLGQESWAFAALPLGTAPDELAGAGPEETLLIADGAWCGRPDDFGAAHLEADPRLISVGEFQEEIPYLPEQDRRAVQSVASIRAANGDGGLDSFQTSRTIDGQIIRGFLGEPDGYSRDWITMFEALGVSANPEPDECAFEVETVANLLEVPALRSTYGGTGGAEGDARLVGKYRPLPFGDCFNVEPDLEDFGNQIDFWSVTPLEDITVVRDRGAPLTWDGIDRLDYASLASAVVAPGSFTKALTIGRTKRGAQSAGRITGDIKAPLKTTADILLSLARGAAALPEDLINAQAFGTLPIDKVDLFLKGDRQVPISEIYDALLRPFNGWYGPNGDRRLSVGMTVSPVDVSAAWQIENDDVFADGLSVRKFDEPPRWRLGVTGRRNWTPMTVAELVDWQGNPNLTQAQWERLQREDELSIVEDSVVQQRHRGAFDALEKFGPVRGYFTEQVGMDAAAQRLFALFKNNMRKIEVVTGMNALFARPGAVGRIQYDARLELGSGRNGAGVGRRFAGDRREIAMTIIVPMV